MPYLLSLHLTDALADYVAADEVDWNYTPLDLDQMMGMPFTDYAKMYTERGPHRIGSTHRKAIYREYTDELSPRSSRVPPSGSTPDFSARCYAPKLVTPSRSFSRTTPLIRGQG